MDNVFDQLSKIESTASSILDQANARKKQMAADQEERIRRLNEDMHKQTEETILHQKELLGKQIQSQLEQERLTIHSQLTQLEQGFAAHHTQLAGQLLAGLVKE